jgi:hypothetical protein
MSLSVFVDQDHPPTPAELQAALGARYALWEALRQFMQDGYALAGDWDKGGPKSGWNLWYRRSGKTLTNLFPQRRGFVAQVVLGRDQVARALTLKLGARVGQVLRETPQFHDGRWLFIPVKSRADVRDVQALIQLKRRPQAPR